MRRSNSLSLAIASIVLLPTAMAAVRPHYGGTLRIETTAPLSPRQLVPLVYETLLRVDDEGGLQSLLATTWETTDAQHWRFRLRRGARWHDGAPVEPAQVAAALAPGFTDLTFSVDGELLAIDSPRPRNELPWELADAQHAVILRTLNATQLGTGPFALARQEQGRLLLRAHPDHWGGRPFLDSIQIDVARNTASPLSDLELGRADLVSIQPGDARRLAQRQLRLVASRPLQLYAIMFEAHRAGATQAPLRRALSAAIDRSAIGRVVFQGLADTADTLLPAWLSGYGPMPVVRDAPRLSAAAIGALSVEQRSLVVRVDAGDPVAQLLADRVAVNAREIGILVSVQTPGGIAPRFDARIVRAAMTPSSPDRVLAQLVAALGPRAATLTAREVPPVLGPRLPEVYNVESALLENAAIIPLVHVPELYGVRGTVRSAGGAIVDGTGTWNLADVWLAGTETPAR